MRRAVHFVGSVAIVEGWLLVSVLDMHPGQAFFAGLGTATILATALLWGGCGLFRIETARIGKRIRRADIVA